MMFCRPVIFVRVNSPSVYLARLVSMLCASLTLFAVYHYEEN